MLETIRYRPLAEPGAAAVTFFRQDHRAPGAGRRELDYTEVVARREVGVEPPTQTGIEALGAIDIRNRDDDDL
jgi:hypothetical protein